jgi:hypothetical protein
MADYRSEVRRQFTRILGFTLFGVLGGFALTTCGGEPGEDIEEPAPGEGDVEMAQQELSGAQCRQATNGGRKNARICHYDSKKKNFVGMSVNERSCCAHTRDSKDFIDTGSGCSGGGCKPVNAACDKNKKCCAGLSCKSGKCKPDQCLPQGTACIQFVTNCCNGCSCGDPQDPTNCSCL